MEIIHMACVAEHLFISSVGVVHTFIRGHKLATVIAIQLNIDNNIPVFISEFDVAPTKASTSEKRGDRVSPHSCFLHFLHS